MLPVLPDTVRDALTELQGRIAAQLPTADPLGRLAGRPMVINPVDAQTLEITFHEVPQVSETEVRAVRRLLGVHLFCVVSPESERTLAVTFICHLGSPA